MIDRITKAIQETVKYGAGQTVLAFGAWTYVLIMLLVAVFYTFLCLARLLFHKKSR